MFDLIRSNRNSIETERQIIQIPILHWNSGIIQDIPSGGRELCDADPSIGRLRLGPISGPQVSEMKTRIYRQTR